MSPNLRQLSKYPLLLYVWITRLPDILIRFDICHCSVILFPFLQRQGFLIRYPSINPLFRFSIWFIGYFLTFFAVRNALICFYRCITQITYKGRTIIFSSVAPVEPDINIKAFIKPIGTIIYRTCGRSAIYTAVKPYKSTNEKY